MSRVCGERQAHGDPGASTAKQELHEDIELFIGSDVQKIRKMGERVNVQLINLDYIW